MKGRLDHFSVKRFSFRHVNLSLLRVSLKTGQKGAGVKSSDLMLMQ